MRETQYTGSDSEVTYVLLDESGNRKGNRLLVGATVTDRLKEIDSAIVEMHDLQKESPQLDGLHSFKKFMKDGFHHSEDPREIQGLFLDALSRLPGYRTFISTSERARLAHVSDAHRFLLLYGALLPDVISNSRSTQMHFLFEQNPELQKHFGLLVEKSVDRARASTKGRSLPSVAYSVVGKTEVPSIAITDYSMAVVSEWIEDGKLSTDKRLWAYRNYLYVEKNLALVLDFDHGLRSTRARRDFH